MENHQLINQDSGNTEWYTPPYIIEMAREVMGSIDLDPFSSAKANEIVKAKRYFTIADDGLYNRIWKGNVWMNHPFGRKLNKLAIEKLTNQYIMGHITQSCCITFASTSEKWFRPLLDFPQCYIYGRINYLLPNGQVKKGVTKGSVVTYMGNNVDKFTNVFSKIGRVKI